MLDDMICRWCQNSESGCFHEEALEHLHNDFTSMNSIGDKGSPCRSSLALLLKDQIGDQRGGEWEPQIRFEKTEEKSPDYTQRTSDEEY